MTELRFSPEADRRLDLLEKSHRECASRVHAALDRLEAEPGAARNRRRRFQTLDAWGVDVRCPDEDWLILWSYLAQDPTIVVVDHIVPMP